MKMELNGLVREVTSPVDIVQMLNDGWREIQTIVEGKEAGNDETVQETQEAVPAVNDGKKNKNKKGGCDGN